MLAWGARVRAPHASMKIDAGLCLTVPVLGQAPNAKSRAGETPGIRVPSVRRGPRAPAPVGRVGGEAFSHL
jgi:hypothetical protein